MIWGQHGRVVGLLVELHLSNIPVMVLGRIIILLYFLSLTTAVAEAHDVIAQLSFSLLE